MLARVRASTTSASLTVYLDLHAVAAALDQQPAGIADGLFLVDLIRQIWHIANQERLRRAASNGAAHGYHHIHSNREG